MHGWSEGCDPNKINEDFRGKNPYSLPMLIPLCSEASSLVERACSHQLSKITLPIALHFTHFVKWQASDSIMCQRLFTMGQFDDVTNLSNGWQLTFVLTAQPHMTHCDTVFSFHYITTLNLLVLYWLTQHKVKGKLFPSAQTQYTSK